MHTLDSTEVDNSASQALNLLFSADQSLFRSLPESGQRKK